MTTPGLTPAEITRTFEAGVRYIYLGWRVFLLARDDDGGKIPFKNCERCDVHTGEAHDREACACPTCHGFYAATSEPALWGVMIGRAPGGFLAVRTGAVSRLLVLDFEADGLETLDRWEEFTSGEAGSLPRTAVAASQGGGRHLFYRIPADHPGLMPRSLNRVLPGLDVKCEGGYVAVPGSLNRGRRWLVPPDDGVAQAPTELLVWLATRGGRRSRRPGEDGDPAAGSSGSGAPAGYRYTSFLIEGPPGGSRDYFFNDMCFRLRRRGYTREDAHRLVREVWERAAQPPRASWYMPWEHVEYKIRRVWHEVDPETPPAPRQVELARLWGRTPVTDLGDVPVIRRVGRINLVTRRDGT